MTGRSLAAALAVFALGVAGIAAPSAGCAECPDGTAVTTFDADYTSDCPGALPSGTLHLTIPGNASRSELAQGGIRGVVASHETASGTKDGQCVPNSFRIALEAEGADYLCGDIVYFDDPMQTIVCYLRDGASGIVDAGPAADADADAGPVGPKTACSLVLTQL